MEVVITSLDALIHRATNACLDRPEPAALEAFCSVLGDSPNGAYVATRVIASRMRSIHPPEALLALDVLDCCMKRCDASFRAEVDKFRFLNEMIKLVSPKYYGSKTAPAVRQKVLTLMHGWTIEFPRELKIRDAYEMLKKQGVVKDLPPTPVPPLPPQEEVPPPVPRPRNKDAIFEDEERSRMLQKLLQSKNPDDLQAANRLIKTMVREDERRVEAVSRRITELQTVHNNARLLDEMLEQYKPGVSSAEDLELIRELHAACNRLRPTVFKLAAETQQNEEMLSEVLEASDELGQVFEKYTAIILHGKSLESVQNAVKTNCQPGSILLDGEGNSLLDLATPATSQHEMLPGNSECAGGRVQSNMKELGDIFSNVHLEKSGTEMNTVPILKPVSITSPNLDKAESSSSSKPLSQPVISRGLAELDALGADMLKDSLPPSSKAVGQFNNKQPSDRIPMNLLPKSRGELMSHETEHKIPTESKTPQSNLLDLDFLISKTLNTESKSHTSNPSHNDDLMVDISSDDSLIGAKSRSQEEDPEISLLEYLNELKDTKEGNILPRQSRPNNASTYQKPEPEITKEESEQQERKELFRYEKKDKALGIESKIKSLSNDKKENDLGPKQETSNPPTEENTPVKTERIPTPSELSEAKILTGINISLDSITPGDRPPLTAYEEEDGISVMFHFTKNKPRANVSVIVVSTTSRSPNAIKDFKFQAVVPKVYKVRLLPQSGDSFPAFSPFLPPAAATQVMLIARPPDSPSPHQVTVKFVVTYSCQDDSISEIGEVKDLPLL